MLFVFHLNLYLCFYSLCLFSHYDHLDHQQRPCGCRHLLTSASRPIASPPQWRNQLFRREIFLHKRYCWGWSFWKWYWGRYNNGKQRIWQSTNYSVLKNLCWLRWTIIGYTRYIECVYWSLASAVSCMQQLAIFVQLSEPGRIFFKICLYIYYSTSISTSTIAPVLVLVLKL